MQVRLGVALNLSRHTTSARQSSNYGTLKRVKVTVRFAFFPLRAFICPITESRNRYKYLYRFPINSAWSAVLIVWFRLRFRFGFIVEIVR